jgi:hypothetical protein
VIGRPAAYWRAVGSSAKCFALWENPVLFGEIVGAFLNPG